MNPNDPDGHQVGNDLNSQQGNTFTPRVGDAVNAPQTIISSTPDSEDKKESTITRAFGGRSRASQIAAQANSHPSALRQNAPEFFQQSMQQQDVILNAAAEQKAKSKKGLIIGGIVGGALILIVAVVAIISSITSNPVATPEETLKAALVEEDVVAVSNLESGLLHLYNNEIGDTDIFSAEFKDRVETGVSAYRKIYDSLQEKSKQFEGYELKEDIDKVLSAMSINIEHYETAGKNYLLIYDAIVNNDSTKIDNVSSDIKDAAMAYYEGATTINQLSVVYDTIDCSKAEVLDPSTGYNECDRLDDEYEEAISKIRTSNLAKKLFFGNNISEVKDNIVKDTLNVLYINMQEAEEEGDNEE